MLRAYVDETGHVQCGAAPLSEWRAKPRECPAGRAVLDAEPPAQIALIRVALDWSLSEAERLRRWHQLADVWRVSELLNALYRRRQPYAAADVAWFARRLAAGDVTWERLEAGNLNLRGLLRGGVAVAGAVGSADDDRARFARLRANLAGAGRTAAGRETQALLDQLRGHDEPLIDADDDWGAAATSRFDALPSAERDAWGAVLCHAATTSGSKPSRAWLAGASAAVARVGPERARALTADWLRLTLAPTRGATYRRPDGFLYPTAFIAERNADLVKGLAWLCPTLPDPDGALAAALGDAGLACFKKLPNIGARSTKAGNACVYALGATPGLAAVSRLQRLAERVKLPSAQKQIAAALRAGLTRDDLDDLAAPTCGLEDGRVRAPLGDDVGELVPEASGAVELRFIRPDGRVRASVPAEARRAHAAEVKALRQAQSDLRAALTAQRARRAPAAGRSRVVPGGVARATSTIRCRGCSPAS